jgi:hypothetical protein
MRHALGPPTAQAIPKAMVAIAFMTSAVGKYAPA